MGLHSGLRVRTACLAMLAMFSLSPSIWGADVQVKIENLSGAGGLFLTPFWVGFHDGGFDVYDSGSAASAGLERIAEDGDVTAFRGEFAAASATGQDGVITAPLGFPGAPVFDPGDMNSMTFNLNPSTQRFFSYAAMVIPSNDAFLANGNPTAFELFDAGGNFNGPIVIDLLGSAVLDAGTEDNTEMDAAFFDQMAPDAGTATVGGTVGPHAGFIGSVGNPGGTPIILGGTSIAPPGFTFDAVAADFTLPNVTLGRITITAVPEPGMLAHCSALLCCLLPILRRR